MSKMRGGNRSVPLLAALAALWLTVSPASASPFNPTGVIKLVKHAHANLNTNQSTNWFGYNQGTLGDGGTLFHSVTADWTVPAASPHASHQAESSATWIGVGGGCLDAGCALSDATLIQTGTEQDVDSSAHSSYSAWWELVPAPSVTINGMRVSPGDHMHASIAETVPLSELWTITLQDLTKHETFATTVPYASTHSTAEWIDETPLAIGLSGTGQTSLPKLTETPFDHATVNGQPAHLTVAQSIQLVDGTGAVIGRPSAPDAEADGFGDCAWARTCSVQVAGTHSPRAAHPVRRHHRRKHRHKPARH
jgi:Peptidase A4 family